MTYASELVLVKTFVKALMEQEAPLAVTCYTREFANGTSSRPDIIAVSQDGEVMAIEAKLTRWRDAMQQAYINAFFADRSWVLLPQPVAERAAQHLDDFELRGVGICTLIEGVITVISDAPKLDPHNIYRREMARERALKRRRRIR